MDNFENPDSNGNKMFIEAFGKSCKLTPYLSVYDLEMVSRWTDEDLLSKDYRFLVAEIIAKHTNDVFSAEEILKLDDSVFQEYICICVEGDEKLRKNYLEQSTSDIYKRFIYAIKETEKDYAILIATSFKSTLIPELQQIKMPKVEIPKIAIPKVEIPNITSSITPVIQLNQSLKKLMSSMDYAWSDNLKKLAESMKYAIPNYSSLFNGLASAFQELLKGITIPTVSEEKKQQLIDSYTEWGRLGWTLPPDAELSVFKYPPINGKDAYNRLRYCTNDASMEKLFEKMVAMPNLKKSDLKEAIECFKSKYYKSCCLILFSMIDSRLIRSQIDSDRNRNGFRPSGEKAVKKLFDRIEANHITDKMLFTMLDQVNLVEALKTFFSNGDDFKEQPKILNRNFLDHGMLYRKVNKKDCVMLFLLLYNFTNFLNLFVN